MANNSVYFTNDTTEHKVRVNGKKIKIYYEEKNTCPIQSSNKKNP